MKIGDFDLSFKHIAIIFVALILIMGIFSMMGSNDISVYGISFHVPDGYGEIEQKQVNNAVGESYELSNKDFHESIFITVKDTNAKDINSIKLNYPAVKQYTVIDGKDGLLAMTSSTGVRNHYYYVENGKLIDINAPFVDPQSGLNDENFIAEIIK